MGRHLPRESRAQRLQWQPACRLSSPPGRDFSWAMLEAKQKSFWKSGTNHEGGQRNWCIKALRGQPCRHAYPSVVLQIRTGEDIAAGCAGTCNRWLARSGFGGIEAWRRRIAPQSSAELRARRAMLFSTNSAIALSGLLCDSAIMRIAFQSSPIRSLPLSLFFDFIHRNIHKYAFHYLGTTIMVHPSGICDKSVSRVLSSSPARIEAIS